MRSSNFLLRMCCALALISVSFLCPKMEAQSFTTLANFPTNSANGLYANSAPIADGKGNLYGSTQWGGNSACFLGCGTIWQLSPVQGGGWSLTTIYTFLGGSDGFYPVSDSALLMDAAGNLYGETAGGNGSCASTGCGTVFELSPNGSGGWNKSTLHGFQGSDGDGPNGGLAIDSFGNVYGVTAGGGTCSRSTTGCGVVFQLRPQSGGSWTEDILHSFGSGSDGYNPHGLVFSHGNLFGITYSSPSSANCTTGCGTVFELTHSAPGVWTETILHAFQGPDGELPLGAPELDAAGSIYGSTQGGGVGGQGVVYKLAHASGGWQYHVIHAFSKFANGQGIYAPVTLDAAGNVYGTTLSGGNKESACPSGPGNGCGLVFKLVRPTSGPWIYQVLYSFTASTDGNNPEAGVTLDSSGNIFGTTGWLANSIGGTVFEITP